MACRLYEYYEEALGKFVYCNPCGCPIPSNRIVAMYHSESATSMKNAVSTSLSDPSRVMRRVFATQSLSMGIHCLNVRSYSLGNTMNTRAIFPGMWTCWAGWLTSKSNLVAH